MAPWALSEVWLLQSLGYFGRKVAELTPKEVEHWKTLEWIPDGDQSGIKRGARGSFTGWSQQFRSFLDPWSLNQLIAYWNPGSLNRVDLGENPRAEAHCDIQIAQVAFWEKLKPILRSVKVQRSVICIVQFLWSSWQGSIGIWRGGNCGHDRGHLLCIISLSCQTCWCCGVRKKV